MKRSISSTEVASCAIASPVAAIASAVEAKCPTAMTRCAATGTSATSASTTIASVPSHPTTTCDGVEHAVGDDPFEAVAARLAPVARVVLQRVAWRSTIPGSSRWIAPASVSRAARAERAASSTASRRARVPSASTTSSASIASTVIPYLIDWLPAELLPIMPPSVARFAVEVFGPNCRPCSPAARLSCSWTTPGWTRARRAAGSIASICRRWRERSSTSPGSRTGRRGSCPRRGRGRARRGRRRSRRRRPRRRRARGSQTPSGSIAYELASWA